MKKVILGSALFLAGVLSAAVLLAGTMANDGSLNGRLSASWNLTKYGLVPALYAFIAIAVIGLAMALWGVFEKKD